jgi:hypothetical protein|tara:strand:+ start:20944 stop:21276 length:333 start_codon:yes stop_codon:yes gene_type:complete
MNIDSILTTITPALIAFALYAITKQFPPSLDNSFLSKAPAWWSRDQETWDKAYEFLAKKYLQYALVLLVICIGSSFIDWEYNIAIGYVMLVIFMILAAYQQRAFMQDSVK